jgi:hypothetical protein
VIYNDDAATIKIYIGEHLDFLLLMDEIEYTRAGWSGMYKVSSQSQLTDIESETKIL